MDRYLRRRLQSAVSVIRLCSCRKHTLGTGASSDAGAAAISWTTAGISSDSSLDVMLIEGILLSERGIASASFDPEFKVFGADSGADTASGDAGTTLGGS